MQVNTLKCYICARARVCVCVCVCVCVFMCVSALTHTHTHTHICGYMCVFMCFRICCVYCVAFIEKCHYSLIVRFLYRDKTGWWIYFRSRRRFCGQLCSMVRRKCRPQLPLQWSTGFVNKSSRGDDNAQCHRFFCRYNKNFESQGRPKHRKPSVGGGTQLREFDNRTRSEHSS